MRRTRHPLLSFVWNLRPLTALPLPEALPMLACLVTPPLVEITLASLLLLHRSDENRRAIALG